MTVLWHSLHQVISKTIKCSSFGHMSYSELSCIYLDQPVHLFFLETSSVLPSISVGIILLPFLRCFLLIEWRLPGIEGAKAGDQPKLATYTPRWPCKKKQEWVPGVQLYWIATVGKGPWQTNPIIPVKTQYQEITMDSTCPSENPFLVHWDEALWKFQMWPRFHFPRRSRVTDESRVCLRIYPLENHLSPACKLSKFIESCHCFFL